MLILGADFESNGMDVEKAHITEIGAVLFDTDKGSSIESLSCLLHDSTYPTQPKDIIDLTGITDEMLKQEGILPEPGLRKFQELMHKADYVLAHNKKFDQRIHHHFSLKYNVPVVGTPWICSLTEAKWPKHIQCKKLAHIAFELQPDLLFKDGKKIELHRAMNDVELMLNLVHRTIDWKEFVEFAMEPWVTLQVTTPPPWEDGGAGKDWAKKNGFGWESPPMSDLKYPKCWVKRVKESKVEEEKNDKPYKIERI